MVNIHNLRKMMDSISNPDEENLPLLPHPALRPYIACYMLTLPRTISPAQAVLPTASNTLVYAAGGGCLYGGLRGVNTKPVNIGGYARQFDLLVLVEFHPAGLHPFVRIPQDQLRDTSFAFDTLDTELHTYIAAAIEQAETIQGLREALDQIWLSRLGSWKPPASFSLAMDHIGSVHGATTVKAVSQAAYYSEKQLGRMFLRELGTGVKQFARITRAHHALSLIRVQRSSLMHVATRAGYHDASHLVHDLSDLYGLTPQAYLRRMSLFYSDPYKLRGSGSAVHPPSET